MAKRKNQLADRLNSGAKAKPGWRDIIAQPETTPEPAVADVQPAVEAPLRQVSKPKAKPPAPTYKRKTYLVAPEMIERIEAVADQERVGINQLVRYMLDLALTQIETGEHSIPTTDGKRQINW